jgi:hypothetical protein
VLSNRSKPGGLHDDAFSPKPEKGLRFSSDTNDFEIGIDSGMIPKRSSVTYLDDEEEDDDDGGEIT